MACNFSCQWISFASPALFAEWAWTVWGGNFPITYALIILTLMHILAQWSQQAAVNIKSLIYSLPILLYTSHEEANEDENWAWELLLLPCGHCHISKQPWILAFLGLWLTFIMQKKKKSLLHYNISSAIFKFILIVFFPLPFSLLTPSPPVTTPLSMSMSPFSFLLNPSPLPSLQ